MIFVDSINQKIIQGENGNEKQSKTAQKTGLAKGYTMHYLGSRYNKRVRKHTIAPYAAKPGAASAGTACIRAAQHGGITP
jgi:hypothetical protein